MEQPIKPAPIYRMQIPQVNTLGTSSTLTLWDHCQQKTFLLVIFDDRTRYPEVEVVRNKSAKSTIRCLESIFARHGVPRTIISDNGPPFQGDEPARHSTVRTKH